MNFLQLPDAKYFQRLTTQTVLNLAATNAGFCNEWVGVCPSQLLFKT